MSETVLSKKELALILVQELHGYAMKTGSAKFAEDYSERIKQIGKKLHEFGGTDLMIQASSILPHSHAVKLENLWKGMGKFPEVEDPTTWVKNL